MEHDHSSISDSMKLFNLIKHQSKKFCIPQTLSTASALFNNPEDKTYVFNVVFNSLYSKSNFILPPQNLPTLNNQLSMMTCPPEVFKILTNLDITKSPGCDEISGFILKHCATALVNPITNLFQSSLQTFTLSLDWKIHKIQPVLKNTNHSVVQCYNLTSVYSV